jgi:hypothetical protein
MPRASAPEHAQRLNLALGWLRQGRSSSAAAGRLAAAAQISQRQAHRYVERARELKAPVAAVEPKVVFTVKLPKFLVERLHRYAATTGEALGEIVARALAAALGRGGGHG